MPEKIYAPSSFTERYRTYSQLEKDDKWQNDGAIQWSVHETIQFYNNKFHLFLWKSSMNTCQQLSRWTSILLKCGCVCPFYRDVDRCTVLKTKVHEKHECYLNP